MSNAPKYRTISLTDRAPVRIDEAEWPVLARGSYFAYDGQVVQQSNRRTSIQIIVRRHADGRALVYGVYDYDSHFQHETGESYRRGDLLASDSDESDIIAAIRTVRDELIEALAEDERGDARHVRDTAQECIADMPATTI